MPAQLGSKGRQLLRIISEQLGIEDVKSMPDAMDNDDIKTVQPLPTPNPYQEFVTSVNALTAGSSSGVELDSFRVGGVTENGQSAAEQINSTDQVANPTQGGLISLATDWDYKVLSAVVEIQLTGAQATAEAGNDIEVSWLQYAPFILVSQDTGGDGMLQAGQIPITRINIGDGMTIDADQLVYSFPIYFNQSDSQDSATTWPGWIPGINQSGLGVLVKKRTGSGGANAAWGSAVQHRSRVYGLRFRKGTFPLR